MFLNITIETNRLKFSDQEIFLTIQMFMYPPQSY